MSGHTPGPWRWEVNRRSKIVELCGGDPKGGFGAYDLTVMSFGRYGMQGATPIFWTRDAPPWRRTAHAIAVPVAGREHHEDWFRDIDHPDARLIAAAPDLLHALTLIAERAEEIAADTDKGFTDVSEILGTMAATGRIARAAIAKAEGQQ